MAPRPQQYRLTWPWTPSQVEHVDTMFESLFRALRNGSVLIDASQITGILPEAHGGTGASGFTTGSVIFAGATTLTEDNANLFWDDSTNRLGIGTITPADPLEVVESGDSLFRAHRFGAANLAWFIGGDNVLQDTSSTVYLSNAGKVTRIGHSAGQITLGENVAPFTNVGVSIEWDGNLLGAGLAKIPLAVRGAVGQTANLQEWQDSTGAVLSGVNATGHYLGVFHAQVAARIAVNI